MNETAIPPTPPSQADMIGRLMDLTRGLYRSQALLTAARLGLADALASGPQTVESIADTTHSHAPSLYRLLRLLASLGIFAELDDGRFALTPIAELLRVDHPASLRDFLLLVGTDTYATWGELYRCVQTGQSGYEHLYGMPSWQYRQENPEANARFNTGMASLTSNLLARRIAEVAIIPEEACVVDVGGGNGTLLATILTAHPSARGVLFDQPHVVEQAHAQVEAAGVAGRCSIVGGDFFHELPTDGDVYLLKNILHDWSDERAVAILRQCRRAMKPSARLLVIELVVPEGNGPSEAKLSDLVMLVANPGGRERTEQEWRQLCAAGGFELRTLTDLGRETFLLEAAPV
jgi:SAM-dependent methyltransferase